MDGVDHAVDECLCGPHGRGANPAGSDQDLGERTGGKDDSAAIGTGLPKGLDGSSVVGIARIKNGQQYARVDDYRSHSPRNRSRSVAAVRPGTAPTKSSSGS